MLKSIMLVGATGRAVHGQEVTPWESRNISCVPQGYELLVPRLAGPTGYIFYTSAPVCVVNIGPESDVCLPLST